MVEVQGAVAETTNMNGVDYDSDTEQQDEETDFRRRVEVLLLCPVCHETTTDPRKLNCGQFLCKECVDLLQVDEVVRCPICNDDTPVTEAGIRVDKLASRLLQLLAEFAPHQHREKKLKAVKAAPAVNGHTDISSLPHADSDDEDAADELPDPPTEPATEELGTQTEQVDPSAELPGPPTELPESPTEELDPPTEELTSPTAEADTTTEEQVTPEDEVKANPAEDYQSPDDNDDDDEKPLLPPPADSKLSAEPDESEDKVENTDGPADKDDVDEPDRKMKASEIKPSDVAIKIEMERQCGDCHSSNCTCNVSNTLLTPPVSNGSQLSVETTSSNNPSEDWEPEIFVNQLKEFTVTESANHIEVANKNRLYVTRWTYDENGSVATFDSNGKKIKFVHSGHHNYTGLTVSKLGFVFALNSSKNRLEEFSGVDGKNVKKLKLDLCKDPTAVDIMPTGEILVVDQDRNRVVVYPSSKKGNSKPRAVTHELIKRPHDIATCPEGFYITCSRSLLKMDLEGNVIWSYDGQSDKTRRPLKMPKGVCTDDNGHVYVVDEASSAILVFTKDGELKGRVTEKSRVSRKHKPWYISVRDGVMAVLYQHNIVRTFEFE